MKILSLRVKLFHGDRWTDMTRHVVTIRFAEARRLL